ncbi:hypothetical protein [Pseudomonas xanthosomatis]|uniref:hypothetical protein n=1 Tax=Pseudomonas xanthosomatis TaxID=2842356 RepID=UPI003519A669
MNVLHIYWMISSSRLSVLVKGDEVTLLADAVTDGTFWFFSEYVTASGKVIREWVKDGDVS